MRSAVIPIAADVVFALEETLRKTRRFERLDPTRPAGDEEALRLLQEALHLAAPPRTLECFDISHISGTFVVASMVHFADGRPDKGEYRRFRIRSFVGNDDFRAMEEVVGRLLAGRTLTVAVAVRLEQQARVVVREALEHQETQAGLAMLGRLVVVAH